jgi:hypothetical protein
VLSQKIVVLLHRDDHDFESRNFLLRLMMAQWQDRGASVQVVRGIDRPVDADLLIPHINLTIVPREYVAFMSEYPRVVNRRLIDISKSTFSRDLLGPADDYRGPVIVKTDRNYGGIPEQRLNVNVPSPTDMAWDRRSTMDPQAYPIFESLDDVPAAVFENEYLIVEKFLPESDERGYYLRNWTFFGDQGGSLVSRSREPIVKASNVVDREEAPLPDELPAIRERLGADFAKLDYVLRDGSVVLYDVNRTPTFRGPKPKEYVLGLTARMAEGILNLSYV